MHSHCILRPVHCTPIGSTTANRVRSLSPDNLRTALRAHTSEVHKRLDDTVGALSSVESYKTFVTKSYVFRSAVEPALEPLPNWTPLRLMDALRADLDDLGGVHTPAPGFHPRSNWSANLGRLYVVEGSSVGARLLYNAARKLNFTDKHGARHLALQANDSVRWRQFIAMLDTLEGVDRGEALSAAKQLFEFALLIYSGNGD